MSGFDSKTTGNILDKLFSQNGYFRKAGISVILATHSRMLSECDPARLPYSN